MKTTRVFNEATGAWDYAQPSGKVVFSALEAHRDRTIFQMGTNDANNALATARLVLDDVAGIDVNMGCPQDFSIKGGMGVALMKDSAKVVSILKTLRQNVPANKSVTCKIRLFPDVADTLEFCKMVEACGITALAVHGRTRDERDQHPADWSQIKAIKAALKIPVILNGDVFSFADFERARQETGVDGVMVARGALANCSIFQPQPRDVLTVVKEYCTIARRRQNNYQNTKWTVLRMLGGVTRKDKTHKPLMAVLVDCRTEEALMQVLFDQVGNPEFEATLKKRRL